MWKTLKECNYENDSDDNIDNKFNNKVLTLKKKKLRNLHFVLFPDETNKECLKEIYDHFPGRNCF